MRFEGDGLWIAALGGRTEARRAAVWRWQLRKISGTEGQAAETFAGYCEDGVANRRRNGRHSWLTTAAGRLRAWHNVNLDDGRSFVHAEHLVVMEVALLNAPGLDGDSTLQCLREPKIYGPFHLCFYAERVDSDAAIYRANHAVHSNGASLSVARDFRYVRDVAAPTE
jgi:hypothetical protein